jgi:beta-lactamase superfamily II metal-dependent hydrolase
MDNQLLVRTYNVGLGDCIYIRVPDKNQHRHILIDCGNTDGDEFLLGRAIDHLAGELTADPTGNHALDLLVVTHPHQDHIAGFGIHTDKFLELSIRNMWLSASMDPDHKQAGQAFQLQAFSDSIIEEFTKLPLGPSFRDLALELFSLSNKPALEALRTKLPKKNGYKDDKPAYVHDASKPASIFEDGKTKLHILGPRENIDGDYLGKIDQALNQLTDVSDELGIKDASSFSQSWHAQANHPQNISARDFRRLRARMFMNALAFVLNNNVLVNNTSVVLLLEWGGRRLLFTGDAQFQHTRKGKYEQGKRNGSWNVMWHYHKDKLREPVDFLKVGHHGSHNATPWVSPEAGEPEHPINEILDHLLGKDECKTEVVISTERMKYPSIPDRQLITELGKRVATSRKYDEPKHLEGRMTGGKWESYDPEEELVPQAVAQPLRTDLEYQYRKGEVPFIDLKFSRLDDGS